MCGIVGVVGDDRARDIILEGLRRLEYRGYDSAGVAVMAGATAERRRAVGKVKGLFEKAEDLPGASLGVGHTRWATHGAATEANAHPHRAGRVTLVHNGIIENFRTLKGELEAAGRSFESETDTEVVAHLIDAALEDGAEPVEAVRGAVAKLTGAFALAIMIDGQAGRAQGRALDRRAFGRRRFHRLRSAGAERRGALADLSQGRGRGGHGAGRSDDPGSGREDGRARAPARAHQPCGGRARQLPPLHAERDFRATERDHGDGQQDLQQADDEAHEARLVRSLWTRYGEGIPQDQPQPCVP